MCAELLDYEGTELLLIAASSEDEGVEAKVRPTLLLAIPGLAYDLVSPNAAERESEKTVEEVLRELAVESEKFPADPLGGQWI